jgi:hypothetical protein
MHDPFWGDCMRRTPRKHSWQINIRQQGENEKALALYEKLEKNTKNIPLIHERYFQLMLMTGRFDQAEVYY